MCDFQLLDIYNQTLKRCQFVSAWPARCKPIPRQDLITNYLSRRYRE
jgi:hypothetical protein